MKFRCLGSRTAVSLIVLVLASSYALAQPQYYNDQNVGAGNTFPFGQTSGKAVHWLFLAGELAQPSPLPAGNAITAVYFFMYSSGGSRTYTDLTIKMAQDDITTLTSGQFYPGPWVTVYYRASVTLTATGSTWMGPITLDTPFPYDPARSLVLAVEQAGGVGSGMYIIQNTASNTRRIWSVGGPPFVPYAGGDGRVVNFGVDVVGSTIVVEKQTDPDGSIESFEFSPSYGSNFFLSDDGTNDSGPLATGTYSVSEVNLPWGWSLTSATCDDSSDPSAIDLGVGETVTCVFNNSALDTDGDGIWDSDEGLPTDDRDGDGVPNYQDFDPSGYFYDEATGQILTGGSVSVTGPGVVTIIDDGSATGQYQWSHDGTQGDYTMTVTFPPGYAASLTCLDLGVLNPDATPDPLSLGAGENGSTGFLTDWTCGANSYYSILQVDATNPANIINNNIPLAALALSPIPTLSDRGVIVLVLLLLTAGILVLWRRGAV